MAGLEVEHRPSESSFVERVWRSTGEGPSQMQSITNSHWEMVISYVRGDAVVTIRGPETRHTLVDMPGFDGALGIVFSHGTAMPHLPATTLLDSAVRAPGVSGRRVLLRNDDWELPTYDNAEDFVASLIRAAVVRRDPLVSDVAAGADDHGLTARSVQRRVASVTGLTRGAIRQIERARAAADLLQRGTPVLHVVHALGYFDQPHLARSLSRFIGRTATELQRPDPDVPLSLLYKTPLWDNF